MGISLNLTDFFLVAPMLSLFFASLVPLTIKVFKGNREMDSMSTILYGCMGLIMAAVFLISTQSIDTFSFSKALVFDGMSSFASFLVIGITGATLFYSRENLSISKAQFSEYVFLLLNSAVGMLIVSVANDLIVMFIGIEIMSLCLYLLIALSNEQRLSKEAAFKYFILGSFASAIFLYGIAFIYGSVGSTYMDDISKAASVFISSHRLFAFGAMMVIVGFGFKVALAPWHSWAPDVYQGAPTPVTGFMATGVKVVVFIAFLRWLSTDLLLGDRSWILVYALEWLAVVTMLVGNIAAILQTQFKRMLAYSSVAHAGYALVGLLAATMGEETDFGASSLLLYIFSYTVMTLGTFGVVSLFERREDLSMDSLKGLARTHPWCALAITFLMLSLAGLPPTLGFFGKFVIFSAALKQNLIWLVVWAVVSSVIGIYYYLRPVILMYMYDVSTVPLVDGKLMTRVLVGVSVLGVVVTSFFLDSIYQYILQSVLGVLP